TTDTDTRTLALHDALPICGYCLGITVDHDSLETIFAQCKRRVDTAIVELNPLPDAVGATAKNDDLLAISGCRFAFVLVGRVHVGGFGGELGCAGIDALVHRAHPHLMPQLPALGLGRVQQESQAAV